MMDHKQTKTRKALLRRNLHKICATPPAFHFSLWTDVNEHPTNNKMKHKLLGIGKQSQATK